MYELSILVMNNTYVILNIPTSHILSKISLTIFLYSCQNNIRSYGIFIKNNNHNIVLFEPHKNMLCDSGEHTVIIIFIVGGLVYVITGKT